MLFVNYKNDNTMKITLEGIKIKLISMMEEDAQDFVTLRNNPEYNRFLSNRNQQITVGGHLNWMRNLNNQFDFKIVLKDNNTFSGGIALYDIVTLPETNIYQAEFGRYIAINSISAVESEFMILKFGFDILKLKRIYCNTVKKNEKVWKQHLKFGFRIIGEDYDERIDEIRVMQEIYYDEFKNHDYSSIEKLLKYV
jgi:RimJ/RimL family protein N-acetyltransferase